MDQLKMIKYPRTPHLEGSRLQPGDMDLHQIPFSQIAGRPLWVEEKCDGANAAVSFSPQGELLLQSRGHYLRGGGREVHFNLMKRWAQAHRDTFYGALGSRYIMYGEWMYAKHTIYYDALPSYFLEFDILDRETGRYLDTNTRRVMLAELPVASVPVLSHGKFTCQEDLLALIGDSHFIRPGHLERLSRWCQQNGQDAHARVAETDPSAVMEGLYIKVEEGGQVVARMKYVRSSFLQCVAESGTHWLDRPIIPNQLAVPIETLFAPTLSEGQ